MYSQLSLLPASQNKTKCFKSWKKKAEKCICTLGHKKEVLFPEIGQVKIFYHWPARIVECVSEYTF